MIEVSNQHYGHAANVISPFPPLNMADGFETARSRVSGHSEFLTLALARAAALRRLEFDFKHFVHNNPRVLAVDGLVEATGEWVCLVGKCLVKAFAGNVKSFRFVAPTPRVSMLRVRIEPDGGINRIHAFAEPETSVALSPKARL